MITYSYSFSFDEEHYYGSFASREDAAIAARADRPGSNFWTGRNRPPALDLRWHLDADRIIENILDHEEDFGLDVADEWPNASLEQRAELTTYLEKTFRDWMTRYDLQPKFFIAEDVQFHGSEI